VGASSSAASDISDNVAYRWGEGWKKEARFIINAASKYFYFDETKYQEIQAF
jgi:hypothetical protein